MNDLEEYYQELMFSLKNRSSANDNYIEEIFFDDCLKVLINANKPTGTDFRLYFRTSGGDGALSDKDFTLATIESPVATTDNALSYSQHIFLIGGKNGSLPSFTKFQLKIVFTSTNRAKVPTLSSLRAIAMST